MKSLVSGPWNALATLIVIFLLWKAVPPFFHWAFLDAVWQPDAKACRAAHGACWGFIVEKHRFILFGTYPYEQHWRPALATLILVGLWAASLVRAFWKPWLALVWLGGLAAIVEHERSGLHYPPGDTAALAAAVERVLSDRTLRERLSRCGPGRVRALCNPGRLLSRLEAVIERARGGAAEAAEAGAGPAVSILIPF